MPHHSARLPHLGARIVTLKMFSSIAFSPPLPT